MQAKITIRNMETARSEMEVQARELAAIASDLEDVRRTLQSGYYGVSQVLDRIRASVNDERRKLDMLGDGVGEILTEYSRTETAIVSGMAAVRFESVDMSIFHNKKNGLWTLLSEQVKTPISNFGTIAVDPVRKHGQPFSSPLFLLGGLTIPQTRDVRVDNYSNASPYGDAKLDNGKAEGSLWKGSTEVESDSLYAGVNAYVGKGEAKMMVEGPSWLHKEKSEYKDGEWTESSSEKLTMVKAEVGASGSAAAADGEIKSGDDMFGSELKAEGGLGNAELSGSGEVSVGDKGANAYVKGKALVSAAEGKVSGTINIFGMEIKAEAGGYAGAAGVEGEAGIKDGKFVLKGGAAAGVGGSLGIEIGFNETGWDNLVDTGKQFVDFLTFWD